MQARSQNVLEIGKSVLEGIRKKNVTFLAGSIAYHAFISLVPLLVLVFFLVSAVGDEGVAAQVAATAEGMLPEAGQDLLEDAIAGSVATAGTSIVGLVTLLWGSLKLFRGLDTAFSEIYDSTDEGSFLGQLRDAFVVFAAIGTALVAASVASGVFAFFPDSALVGLLNPILLVVGLTVAFLPMYYYFPDVPVTVRGILPGVLVAAVGWAALQGLFQVYVAFASGSESADAIGAILLLLTWLYFGGLVLLVGGVVNATLADRMITESDTPDEKSSDTGDQGRMVVSDDDLTTSHPAHELERLREKSDRLSRELSVVQHDLESQRERRYRLEDRVERLEERNRHLHSENNRLRRRLDRHRHPTWRRIFDGILSRVNRVSVGTVSRTDSRK